jgi:hypothetical protein
LAAFAGWLIGILPYLEFLSRRGTTGMIVAFAFVTLAFVVVLRSLTHDVTQATEEPERSEWLLATGSSISEGVVTTLAALSFYGLGYGGAQLWNVLGIAPVNSGRFAFWTSIAVALVLGLAGASMAVEKITRTLYPATAGTRSVYYPLLRQKLKLIAFSAGVVAAIVIVLIDPGAWRSTVIAAVILLYVAMPLDQLEESSRPRTPGLTDSVAWILESAGYAIVRAPRTGDPMIDPLIQNVTLLASSGDDGLAIEVTDRGPKDQVEWNAASAVRTAANVLQQQMLVEGRQLRSVQPVLIVAGGTVSAGLQRFSETEGVRLVHLQRDGGDEGERLQESLRAIGISVPTNDRDREARV